MKAMAGHSLRVLSVLMAAVFAAACADYTRGAEKPLERAHDADVIANSYQATERLLQHSQQVLDKKKPILVASLVSLANLQKSSNLGRIIGEQISSRLTQLGYETREMKFRGSILVRKGGGEFILSRELRNISLQQDAQAVITGVYAVARDVVYITLRIVRAEDSVVIASIDYTLPMGPNTASLLTPYDLVAY